MLKVYYLINKLLVCAWDLAICYSICIKFNFFVIEYSEMKCSQQLIFKGFSWTFISVYRTEFSAMDQWTYTVTHTVTLFALICFIYYRLSVFDSLTSTSN